MKNAGLGSLVAVAGACLTASMHSQTTLTVPPAFETIDANSGGTMAGFSARYRQQMLVDGGLLTPMQNKTIGALWFRRDELRGRFFQSSTTHLKIRVASAGRPTTAPSRRFADNLGPNAQTVFDGTLNLPATGPPPGIIPAVWTTPWAIRIPFSTGGFPYQNGDLCIQVDGTPQNPPANFIWWVDCDHEADVGTVQQIGTACGAPATETQRTAGAWGRGMVAGSTFTMVSWGWPGSIGVMMLGTALPGPLSLDFVQAPNCQLYVQPQITVPAIYPAAFNGETFGRLPLVVHVPSHTAFLATRVAAQWANIEPPGSFSNPGGITTTNGLDITLGGKMPLGSISTVRSESVVGGGSLSSLGWIWVSRGPVMQFEYQ